MSHSAQDGCKETAQLNQQPQNQQTPPTETASNASEIEKLYLKIKEDWL